MKIRGSWYAGWNMERWSQPNKPRLTVSQRCLVLHFVHLCIVSDIATWSLIIVSKNPYKLVKTWMMSEGMVDRKGSGGGGKQKQVVEKLCKERERLFREIGLDPPDYRFETLAILTFFLSVLSVAMNWKYAAWVALMLSVINIGNFRHGCDVKQVFSSIFISVMSLYILYLKNPNPLD